MKHTMMISVRSKETPSQIIYKKAEKWTQKGKFHTKKPPSYDNRKRKKLRLDSYNLKNPLTMITLIIIPI